MELNHSIELYHRKVLIHMDILESCKVEMDGVGVLSNTPSNPSLKVQNLLQLK